MSTNCPEIIEEENLSFAWAKALRRMLEPDRTHAPITLSVRGFSDAGLPIEHLEIREAVDAQLKLASRLSVADTAYTIFPNDIWEYRGRPSHNVFSGFFTTKIFPFMYRMDKRNRSGTYFQRMVAFGVDVSSGKIPPGHIDQIAKIVAFWSRPGTHRRSALQLACFDPARDHHMKPRSGFPCLQQVSLSFDAKTKSLAITGFYPSEYIFDRGYGNYLGLCHLGRYFGAQMGLKLARMNCVIAHPLLGSAQGKNELGPLAEKIEALMKA